MVNPLRGAVLCSLRKSHAFPRHGRIENYIRPVVSHFSNAPNEEVLSRFSTPPASTTPTPRKSRLPRIAPLKITQPAADRIIELLSSNPEMTGVRLGVKRRGCNGLSYTLKYTSETHAGDEEVKDKGVRVSIEPQAMFHIVGTVMDYEETAISAEFTFVNPNEKGRCGCGESFNV